jgi:expansin (peptidoglycan-binding protein)
VTGTAFPVGSTVIDLTASNAANGDILNTITNFDTSHGSSGRLQLAPITTSGNLDTANPVQLAHGGSRVFLIGLYMPAPAGTNQNYLQGLQSIFGLTWHLDQ